MKVVKSPLFVFVVLVLVAILAIIYLVVIKAIPVYYVQLNGQSLDKFVEMSVFKGIRPDMGKVEVTSILGKPSHIYVGEDPEYEDDPGERWEYILADGNGILNYYFEHNKPDGGIGSPEYIPRDLNREELFKTDIPKKGRQKDGKYIIELRDKKQMLTVRMMGNKVEKINYYKDYISETVGR